MLKNKEKKKKHNIQIRAQAPRKGNKVLFDWMSLTNVYNLYCAKIKTMTAIYRKLIAITFYTLTLLIMDKQFSSKAFSSGWKCGNLRIIWGFWRKLKGKKLNKQGRKLATALFKKTIQCFVPFSKLIREMSLFWNSTF